MTLYDFIITEFSAEKRKTLVKWGLLPQRVERDLEIYAGWLALQGEKKMEIYAELAERFKTSESLVREAIKKLAQEI